MFVDYPDDWIYFRTPQIDVIETNEYVKTGVYDEDGSEILMKGEKKFGFVHFDE